MNTTRTLEEPPMDMLDARTNGWINSEQAAAESPAPERRLVIES